MGQELNFFLQEYRIPKGWSILYNITDTQDTEWDNADKFYPDRFCDDSFAKREDRYKSVENFISNLNL